MSGCGRRGASDLTLKAMLKEAEEVCFSNEKAEFDKIQLSFWLFTEIPECVTFVAYVL